jgi:tetratricopeptide (TPR) repeat protein/predicted Ser/Thr protein kinase
MKTPEQTPFRCPVCGAGIPPGQPKGLCSRCALQGALELTHAESQVLQPEAAGAPPREPSTISIAMVGLKDFGDYELLEEIARGGMGVVYRARQKSLDRIVAVKLLLSGSLSGDDLIRRFKMEAVSAGSLHHPNIVAIHEVGIHDGQHFLVMDFVSGPNLSDLVRDQPLPGERAATYVKTIAEAIHSAHEKGVLHRDLKPSNVLIDENDEPRVSDFGLARQIDGDSSLTLSGQMLGSPNYMPPEQAAALHQKVGRWSDVYGLGAILYHLLTGRPPFQGATISDTVHQVLNNEATSPRLVNPDVPVDLETICLKCLEKDPEQRYQTAEELAAELGRFLRDEPIEAVPVRGLERLARWCGRNPVVASLAAAVVVTALTGIIGWVVAKERSDATTQALAAKAKADQDAANETRQAAELFQANSAFLLQQALMDTNNLRGPALLKALEEAIRRQPTNHALWRATSEVLKRENRFEDALGNLSKAIDLASTVTNVSPRTRIETLLARSRLLSQMNRQSEADIDYSEAGRINCERKNIPRRDPQAKPEMLDLSPFFQSRLSSFLKTLSTDGEAAITMREEVKRNTGVEFDLRGGMNVYDEAKHLLTGIAVNRRFLRLHVMHGFWGSGAQDAKLAVYVLHYADGQTRELSIRYGQHVRDVWRRDARPPTGALVAWQGKSSGANKDSRGVQFFMATWENPRPESEVRSIDLSLKSDEVYPIVLGITVKEAGPDDPEFWMMQAKEAEQRRDLAESLNIYDRGIQQLPDNPVLWNSKGILLERVGSINEALEAYTTAIETAGRDTNVFLKVLTSARLQRSSLFLKMGRYEEAGMDNCRARNLPLRNPQTPPDLLDLGPFYEEEMSWFLGSKNRDRLKAFLLEVQQNTGVEFDARGFVTLSGTGWREVFTSKRQSVTNIPVNRHCTKLHVLHSTSNVERQGTRIGSYILRFADGQAAELPIVYGDHVRSRSVGDGSVTRAMIGWSGVSDKPNPGTKVTVFMATWANPRPLVEIKSLDFVSALSESRPQLLAITVE